MFRSLLKQLATLNTKPNHAQYLHVQYLRITFDIFMIALAHWMYDHASSIVQKLVNQHFEGLVTHMAKTNTTQVLNLWSLQRAGIPSPSSLC